MIRFTPEEKKALDYKLSYQLWAWNTEDTRKDTRGYNGIPTTLKQMEYHLAKITAEAEQRDENGIDSYKYDFYINRLTRLIKESK